MLAMIVRRLRDIFLMLIVVSFLTILMLETVPGDYCNMILPETASRQLREDCQDNEPPMLEKYLHTMGNLLRLDLGRSLRSGRPITTEIGEQFPSTLKLAFTSLALSLLIGLTGGVIAARGRRSVWGRLLNWTGISLLSLPSFIIAFLMLQWLGLRLDWFPILGEADDWKSLVMPTLAISLPLGSLFMRITRTAVIDVLDKDYVRTAYAKGLGNWQVLFRHALPNALAAIIPFTGLVLTGLLDGTLLIEAIFTRPGLGKYTFESLFSLDYPALQGVVLLVAVLTALANLLADLLQAYLLPQSRSELLGG